PGSLGLLEALAIQLAGFQCREVPVARPARVLLFAADHPVVRQFVPRCTAPFFSTDEVGIDQRLDHNIW
ncbi:MAG: nicotinate-nucleotide--dimethylbenzimidazole phosphoribosyltransferase, partial [Chloroflexaceae bacterium]|nr:nicotinate-nucleotide--dimethylbenzimidazole phosphoribosyltransferase [Chloroflexaceae bacterium]